MPLDDFLAKKDKKKIKKKQNTQSLIEQLTKEAEKSKKSDKESVNDIGKQSVLENDEWEDVDDDIDIDLETINISNLTLGKADDTGPPISVDKDKRENLPDGSEVKKVWGAKIIANEEPKQDPEPEPEPEPNSLYIPPALLKTLQPTANKPNVASSSDFPTLDAVAAEAPTKKADNKQVSAVSDSDVIEEGAASPWAQAGVSRRTPRTATDSLPIAITSHPSPVAQPAHNPSAYVPPFMRSNREPIAEDGGPQFRNGPPHSFEQRSRDVPSGTGRKYDGFTPRESLRSVVPISSGTSGGGWSRGQTINKSDSHPEDPFNDRLPSNTVTVRLPQAAPNNRHTSSYWSSNVNVKTFKETSRDKADFELTQSNRFAGFSEP